MRQMYDKNVPVVTGPLAQNQPIPANIIDSSIVYNLVNGRIKADNLIESNFPMATRSATNVNNTLNWQPTTIASASI